MKKLLFIVDVQNGFVNDNTKHLLPVINGLVTSWEEKSWPIACSRFVNLPGSNWEKLRDWHELMAEPDTLLASDLKVNTPYVFKKSTYSAWSSEVISLAANQQIQDIVLVGIDTNECVLATALAIFDTGFVPWVVEDGCASTGGHQVHDDAISLTRALIGKQQIIQSKELL